MKDQVGVVRELLERSVDVAATDKVPENRMACIIVRIDVKSPTCTVVCQ